MSSIYGVNQPVVPGSGHFLKHYKIPVYYLKLRGQYLTSTKHYREERKGRTEAELSLLFTPEQLSEMTAEEIDNKKSAVRAMNAGLRCVEVDTSCPMNESLSKIMAEIWQVI